jgi:triacylglycerol lipase
MQKPAPEYRTSFVLHPEHDKAYVHFQDAAAHPFQARPAGIPRVNAWWLAEAALAAYWPLADAASVFAPAGLSWEYLREASTDCYVVWTLDAVLVAFRGTQPEWGDIRTDITFVRAPWTHGHVHEGFKRALDVIWTPLQAVLARVSAGRAVWFTGHSLGGALAMLAADRYEATEGVLTIGVPRIGDREFVTAFDARFKDRSLRYVNSADGVAYLPPEFLGYHHAAAGRFISETGVVSNVPPALAGVFDGKGDSFSEVLGAIADSVDEAIRRAPKLFLHHMPKAYAIWTWNDYDAHG